MKNLQSYVNEARQKADAEFNKVDGKSAERNGSHGEWALNPPVDDKPMRDLEKDMEAGTFPKKLFSKNERALLKKFTARDPFFVQGEAGWGKSEIIESMAKKFGFEVVLLNLDKIPAEDLKGLPTIGTDKHGNKQTMNALPDWARIIINNPDKEFLLFLDEFNQADPNVMNAVMPIVQDNRIGGIKIENYFVGAAGNLEWENEGGVSELSGPLMSRFKPIINWDTSSPEAWDSAFKFLEDKWSKEEIKSLRNGEKTIKNNLYKNNLAVKILKEIQKCEGCFVNPREIDRKILYSINRYIVSDMSWLQPDDILDDLTGLAKKDASRSNLAKLSDEIYKTIMNKGEEKQSGSRQRSKGLDMVPEELKKTMESVARSGHFKVDGISPSGKPKQYKYGVSRENFIQVFTDEDILSELASEVGEECLMNAEMVSRLLRKFDEDGVKFKYEKNSDWRNDKRDRFIDPLGDEEYD